MNIGFVNNGWQLGGAETVARQLLHGVGVHGFKATFYVAEGKTFPTNEQIEPLYPRLLSRLQHSRFHAATEAVFPHARWTNRSFRRLAESEHDLIHIHNFHGTYATIDSLAWLTERKPVIWTFHAFWGITGGCDHPLGCDRYQKHCGSCPQLGKWPIGPIDNTAVQLETKKHILSVARITIVAPSHHSAERISKSQVGKGWRVSHIPNGVNPPEFTYLRKADPVFRAKFGITLGKASVLIVNRNFKDPDKGFPIIKEALRRIRHKNIQVLLVGEHSGWAATQLGELVPITDLGYVSSRELMGEVFEVSDIFLFASLAENFPCVILEAMSSECCIVSTPTSGVTEQIVSGETGLLAEDMSGTALAKSLDVALGSQKLSRFLAERARNKVISSFSEDLMVRRYIELYEQVLNN